MIITDPTDGAPGQVNTGPVVGHPDPFAPGVLTPVTPISSAPSAGRQGDWSGGGGGGWEGGANSDSKNANVQRLSEEDCLRLKLRLDRLLQNMSDNLTTMSAVQSDMTYINKLAHFNHSLGLASSVISGGATVFTGLPLLGIEGAGTSVAIVGRGTFTASTARGGIGVTVSGYASGAYLGSSSVTAKGPITRFILGVGSKISNAFNGSFADRIAADGQALAAGKAAHAVNYGAAEATASAMRAGGCK